MKKIITVQKEIVEYFCDYCDERSGTGIRLFYQCKICTKYLCAKCSYFQHDYSDHPDTYCLRCWHIGEQCREQINEIEESSNKKIKELKEQWEQLCLKH